MKKILFSVIMIAFCMVSCNRIDVKTEGTGSLSFAVTDILDYFTVETKSGIDYTDYNNYDVVIEGPTPVSGKYGEMFIGQVVELGSGRYTITVTSPETEPAAFDQPIYQAYEEFEIKAGEVTDLKLTCTPYNCKVTIELSDNFKKELSAYEVVVTNGLGSLVWTKDAEIDDFAAGKAGYFLARGLEVKVKGYRSIDNTEATTVYFVKNPQPAEHHIVKLDAKVTGEIGGIQIDVVTTFKEISDDIYVDGMDESYVDRPDFNGSEDEEEVKPDNSIVWEGNETFEEMVIAEDSQIMMTIKMPAGIEKFVIQVSDNFKGAITEITDGGKDYIDLINDKEICANFADTPLLTGDEIYHQTEIIFDLSTFVPLLCQAASGITVQFILEAEDVNGEPLLIFGDSPVVTLTIPEK